MEIREQVLKGAFPNGPVVVSPDGSYAAFKRIQPGSWVLLDLASGRETEIVSLGTRNVTAHRFSPDGTRLAARILSGGDGDQLSIVRLPPVAESPIVVSVPRPRTAASNKLIWSPDSQWLPYLSSTDTPNRFEVALLEAATGRSQPLGVVVFEGAPDFQWSKDSTEVAIHASNSQAGSDVIRIVTLASRQVRDVPLPGPFQVGTRLQAWLPNGDFAVRQPDGKDPKATHVLLLSATAPQAKRICTTRAGAIMEDERPNRAQGGFADVGTDLCLGITRDGRAQIVWRELERRFFVHDIQTGAERPLTRGNGDELMGFLSPYSSQLAFAAVREGKWGTYMANVDDAPAVPVLLQPVVGYPDTFSAWWHQNGLVTKIGAGDQHVYRAEIDGKLKRDGLVQLTNATFDHTAPSISPDDRRIAYWSEKGLALMEADGSNERILMPNPGNAARSHPPKWRNANEVLIFTGVESGGSHFASVDVNSRKVMQRFGPLPANATGTLRHWDYSKIRDEIIYILPGSKAFVTTVHAYGLAAGTARRLGDVETPGASIYSFLVSPDAGTIAYISLRGNCQPCEFAVASTSTWETKALAQLSDYPAIAAWAPDNRRVLFGATRPRVMDTSTGRSSDLLESAASWDSHGWGSWSSDGSFVIFLVGSTSASTGLKHWSISAPHRQP